MARLGYYSTNLKGKLVEDILKKEALSTEPCRDALLFALDFSQLLGELSSPR